MIFLQITNKFRTIHESVLKHDDVCNVLRFFVGSTTLKVFTYFAKRKSYMAYTANT